MQSHFQVFLIFIIIVFWINVGRIRVTKKGRRQKESFWAKEQQANQTRRKSLDSLNYITIPMEKLPFLTDRDNDLTRYQEELTKLSEKTIVNLTGISNTDLKLRYGVANLDVLTQYDDNFTVLVRLLYQWSFRLHELNLDKEALTVSEYAVEIGSDIGAHYRLLADLYVAKKEPSKIQNLLTKAESLQTLSKNTIIRSLQEYL